jgi:hypothetical protein
MPDGRLISIKRLKGWINMDVAEFETVRKKLCDGLYIVRDHLTNKYFKLNSHPPGDLERARAREFVVRRVIDNFGIVSIEVLHSLLRQDYRIDELRRILKKLEDRRLIIKGYFIDGDDTLYWMTSDSRELIGKYKFRDRFVLSPHDLLAAYLSKDIHAKFGVRGGYYIVFDGVDMIGAFKAKLTKRTLEITEFLRGASREGGEQADEKVIMETIEDFAYEWQLDLEIRDERLLQIADSR